MTGYIGEVHKIQDRLYVVLSAEVKNGIIIDWIKAFDDDTILCKYDGEYTTRKYADEAHIRKMMDVIESNYGKRTKVTLSSIKTKTNPFGRREA